MGSYYGFHLHSHPNRVWVVFLTFKMIVSQEKVGSLPKVTALVNGCQDSNPGLSESVLTIHSQGSLIWLSANCFRTLGKRCPLWPAVFIVGVEIHTWSNESGPGWDSEFWGPRCPWSMVWTLLTGGLSPKMEASNAISEASWERLHLTHLLISQGCYQE